jgi:large subunit ribosomal protein L30
MSKIKITQTKSAIHRPVDQKRTLVALGITKVNGSAEHENTVQIQGMVKKVMHLITVENI